MEEKGSFKPQKRTDSTICDPNVNTKKSIHKLQGNVEIPAETLAFLKKLNEKNQARSLEKKSRHVMNRDEKRKFEIKSEDKNPKNYMLPNTHEQKKPNQKPKISKLILSSKNEIFEFLQNECSRSTELRRLQTEIRDAFRNWNEKELVDFFPFKTKVKFYNLAEKIGNGCFGKVYKATLLLTGAEVALKLIPKNDLKNKDSKKKIEKEINILKRLNGEEGICKLYEYFEDEENVYLVFEYLKNGDLVKYFKVEPLFSEEKLKPFFRKIVEAIGAMHRNSILHRDIKLDNILLDSNFNPKVCDFGISTIVEPGRKITDTGGTPAYLAPEVILAEGKVGPKSDVWSLGILLYLLVYGNVPFKANQIQELY